MARHVAMWIAVIALAALACVSAATAAAYFLGASGTGWMFYAPYSVSRSPSPLFRRN